MKGAIDGELVPRAHQDKRVDTIANMFEALAVGEPFDPENDVAPLATSRHREVVEQYIAAGQHDGGRRPRHLNSGLFTEPTLFANVDSCSTITQEKILEPIICVSPAADEPQMVPMASDTIFDLNASVFTHDGDHFDRLARWSQSGTMGQNGSRTDSAIGCGGFKYCSAGREDGAEVLRPFLEAKTVVTDRPYVG